MKHRVTFLPQGLTAFTPDGATVFNAAHWAGLAMENACGGRGTCGKCAVRLVEGGGIAGESDRRFLPSRQLDEGWRLACQTAVYSDCVVETPSLIKTTKRVDFGHRRPVVLCPNVRKVHLQLAPPSLDDPRSDLTRVNDALRSAGYEPRSLPAVWRSLPALLRRHDLSITAVICGDEWIAIEPGDTTGRIFGLALDIGTTTIAGAILNLSTGEAAAEESLLNPQVAYGADVISRISYATANEDGLQKLQARVAETIDELVAKACARSGVARQEIYEAVAVGNATMLHLLLGIDPASIGVSPFIPPIQQSITLPAAEAGLPLHPEARLSTLPHIGAYVGADIVSGLLATDVLRRNDGKLRLYIDVGTNSEIALVSGDRCLCTAAPAGPALEGGHIHCGMRAGEGAIEHVQMDDDVHLQIVGGGTHAKGICGSGLVDAVAGLLQRGVIDSSGRMVRANGVAGFQLGSREDGIVLTQTDVRALQLAKAAIACGTQVLMERIRAQLEDLHEILLAGAFGSYLNPASARAIGLVPWVPLERIISVGNAAGEGARIALLSQPEREFARQMPDSVEYVELSGHPDFNGLFAGSLTFPQVGG